MNLQLPQDAVIGRKMLDLLRPGRGGAYPHFYLIDAVRGLAAVAVLFWHYQHFFYPRALEKIDGYSTSNLPLYDYFFILYEYGFYAVQIFWVISGFVFAAVYVGTKATSRSFFINRFARLYPLHFITLVIVAVLQSVSWYALGYHQIYGNNDPYHFILNLVFASTWGLEKGPSFNDPIWSVSVEVLVYAAFWTSIPFLDRRGLVGPLALAASALMAFFLQLGPNGFIWSCAFHFFTGTAAFVFFDRFSSQPSLIAGTGGLALVAGALALWQFPERSIIGLGGAIVGFVLLVASFELNGAARHARKVAWIGDSTYGIYLWHVPIQIAGLIVLDVLGIGREIARSPLFLIGFLTITVTVGYASFRFIENPSRKGIRNALDVPNPKSRRLQETMAE